MSKGPAAYDNLVGKASIDRKEVREYDRLCQSMGSDLKQGMSANSIYCYLFNLKDTKIHTENASYIMDSEPLAPQRPLAVRPPKGEYPTQNCESMVFIIEGLTSLQEPTPLVYVMLYFKPSGLLSLHYMWIAPNSMTVSYV